MMDKPLKLVQIGVGFWGWSWVQVAMESPHWDLVGIVDLKQDNLNRAAALYGLTGSQVSISLDDAVKAWKPDAALVVVGAEAHNSVTIDALEHGLHCLVEKPIALTMNEAREMVETASSTGLKLMVSQNYRYKRAPLTIKKFLKKGIIGDIGSVFLNFQKSPYFTGFRIEIDEPLITDMAIHHFDQMRNILELEPVSVLAYSWNTSWSRFRGNPAATVLFEMNNGAVISYTGSWVSQGWETPWDGDWCIRGHGGEVRWKRNQVSFRTTNLLQEVYTKGALETAGELALDLIDLPEEDRWASLGEFANAIHEDREPFTSGKDNLNTLAMVIGACKSIELKREVSIKELL